VVEREWREASDLKPAVVWLAVALVLAAVLRFWGLGQSVPYAAVADEPEIMRRVVAMMTTGDLNPRSFGYGGLIYYLHLPVTILAFMAGAVQGRWHSLAEVDASHFYVWGRALTAVLGVATVLLVHQIGMRWGGRHALLAAGLLALMPLHVRESHYALTGVPMVFFVTLCVLATLRAHEQRDIVAFALAGVAAGLAIAVEYSAALVLVAPLLAAWMTHPLRPSRLAAALATVAAALLTFLVAAPYTLLDLPGFLDGFARLMATPVTGDPGAPAGVLVHYGHLRAAFGWPSMVLLASGVVLGVVRVVNGPGRVRWSVLLAFAGLFFWMVSRRHPAEARDLLPIVPVACVFVAVSVISGVSLLRRFNIPRAVRKGLITALTVMALLPPALGSVGVVRSLRAPATGTVPAGASPASPGSASRATPVVAAHVNHGLVQNLHVAAPPQAGHPLVEAVFAPAGDDTLPRERLGLGEGKPSPLARELLGVRPVVGEHGFLGRLRHDAEALGEVVLESDRVAHERAQAGVVETRPGQGRLQFGAGPFAHRTHPLVHLRGVGLGRSIPVRLVEHQPPIHERANRGGHGRLASRHLHQPQVDRGTHVRQGNRAVSDDGHDAVDDLGAQGGRGDQHERAHGGQTPHARHRSALPHASLVFIRHPSVQGHPRPNRRSPPVTIVTRQSVRMPVPG
jgi:hypothetical protein